MTSKPRPEDADPELHDEAVRAYPDASPEVIAELVQAVTEQRRRKEQP